MKDPQSVRREKEGEGGVVGVVWVVWLVRAGRCEMKRAREERKGGPTHQNL